MNRRNFFIVGLLGIVGLVSKVDAATLIDRRTPRQKRKQGHAKRNAFRGKLVSMMSQPERNDLLQTLAEIEGLI